MPETFPDDTALLAQSEDAVTGVPFIETGASPYFLQFRRMLHRLLRASERANDLRVYHAGGRLIGVRGGRCFVGAQPREVAAVEPIEVDASETTWVYLDSSGIIQTDIVALPTDRATFIPLAQVTTDADTVTALIDLRGESILQAQTAALAGISATSDAINLALDGAGPTVTSTNLDTLTAGPGSSAQSLHRHLDTIQTVDGEASVRLTNLSTHGDANAGLDFSIPNLLPDSAHLLVDTTTGTLQQRYLGVTRSLVGSAVVQHLAPGAMSVGVTTELAGVVPIAGTVSAVVLSCATNIESSTSSDGVSAQVMINGSVLTTTDPALTDGDGIGFVSTDQGAGTAAVVSSGAVASVLRGDIVTVQWTHTAGGTIIQPPTDLAVLVVIRAAKPE